MIAEREAGADESAELRGPNDATVSEPIRLWYGPPPWPRVLEAGERVRVVEELGSGLARVLARGRRAVVETEKLRRDSDVREEG